MSPLHIVRVGVTPKRDEDYRKNTRVYFHPVGESVLENLVFRRSRPVDLYKKLLRPALKQVLELPEVNPKRMNFPRKVAYHWSVKAGCRMCPCSPGFILRDTEDFPFTIWVEVGGKKEAQMDPSQSLIAEDRFRQIMADPTLAPLIQGDRNGNGNREEAETSTQRRGRQRLLHSGQGSEDREARRLVGGEDQGVHGQGQGG